MNRKLKVMMIAVIAAMVLAVYPLTAQSEPRAPESNTSAATGGLFTTDVDDYFSVHSYSGVEFDKWFGYAGYGDDSVKVGYARRFGGIYLGAYYDGYGIYAPEKKTDTITTTYTSSQPNDSGDILTKVTKTDFAEANVGTKNSLGVLLGIAGMGFKIGFLESLSADTKDTDPNNSQIVTETPGALKKEVTNEPDTYSSISGTIAPSLEWGMSIALGGGGLTVKPKVGAAGVFGQDNKDSVRKDDTTIDGTTSGLKTIKEGSSYNTITPYFSVGADVDLPAKEDSTLTVGINYAIGFKLASNNYDVFGQSGTQDGYVWWWGQSTVNDTGSAKITTDGTSIGFTEQSALGHEITPSLYYYKDLSPQVSLGFGAAFDLGFSSSSESYSSVETSVIKTVSYSASTPDTTTTTVTTQAWTTDSNTNIRTSEKTESGVTFAPVLSVGAKYQAIPGKLTINAGLQGSLPSLDSTTTVTRLNPLETVTTKTVDSNGVVINNTNDTTLDGDKTVDTQTTETTWNGMGATVSGGFTIFFTPNFALDTVLSGGFGGVSGELDTTSGGSGPFPIWVSTYENKQELTSSVKLLLSIKF
jgi:hypothetical protein